MFDPFDRRTFLQLTSAAAIALAARPLLAGVSADAFGIPDEDLRTLLGVAMSRGGDYADLYFERTRSLNMVLEDDRISRANTVTNLGVGVRVVKGDSVGYAFSEVLELAAIKKAAQTAAEIADGSAQSKIPPIQIGKVARYYSDTYRFGDVDVETKKRLVMRVNDMLKKKDPRIKKTIVTYGDSERDVYLVASDGSSFRDHQPMTRLSASCVAEQGTRSETGRSNIATREGFSVYSDVAVERLVSESVRRTVLMFDAVTPKGGEMPVVLAAGPSGILLHEAIGHGMEADFNRKNSSIYASKLNKPVAEKFVTIVDDGTLKDARGSINVDDEGGASQKTVLVDNGTLASYLHDKISAKHYGVKPTGNGRRESFRHTVMPRMRSTYMLNGPHKKEEIIKAVKNGIYCESFANGQVNIGAGDFTFFVQTGYIIENGKLTRPIKDINIIGNGPDVLTKISMVADDLQIDEGGWTCGKNGQNVPVSQGMPTVLVKAMTVGGVA